MPELPEVETTRLTLAPYVEGARVLGARLGKPLRWPLGLRPERLIGRTVGRLGRRGKYLWMPLPGAADPHGGLLWHLGMSGALRFDAQPPPHGPHDHFDLLTSAGTLRLTDPRRFGAVVWSASIDSGAAARLLARLGVEPLEPGFTAALLHQRLRGRRQAIKPALLAGDVVVGVGNIYCSEALFRAGVDPRASAGRISLARCERLVEAIRATLHDALAAGGSTLRDFSNAHGTAGAFQHQAAVYDRAGAPCPACGAAVRRVVQGQRATYFCPRCQRR